MISRILLAFFISFPTYAQVPHIKKPKSEEQCLTDNMYYEAGLWGPAGMRAVGFVTLNRVRHGPPFPKTVCGVVYHKYYGTAQFSWTVQRRLPHKDIFNYNLAILIARDLLQGTDTHDPTQGALFFASYEDKWFHRAKVHKRIIQTHKVGPHRFYRMK